MRRKRPDQNTPIEQPGDMDHKKIPGTPKRVRHPERTFPLLLTTKFLLEGVKKQSFKNSFIGHLGNLKKVLNIRDLPTPSQAFNTYTRGILHNRLV